MKATRRNVAILTAANYLLVVTVLFSPWQLVGPIMIASILIFTLTFRMRRAIRRAAKQ